MEKGKVSTLETEWQTLVGEAREVQRRAHAPYSRYQVGCVIVDSKGKVFSGCNVENASYSATLCAERVAVGKLVSEGGGRLEQVVLITPSDVPCFPCGVCLQVLSEFGPKAQVLTVDGSCQNYSLAVMAELLPEAFSSERLESK